MNEQPAQTPAQPTRTTTFRCAHFAIGNVASASRSHGCTMQRGNSQMRPGSFTWNGRTPNG